MNDLVMGLLFGGIGGIILVPICIWLYHIIKKTKERRAIKRMIAGGQFLKTIDTRDYDTKAWKNEINPNESKGELDRLNNIFVKKDELPEKFEGDIE